MGEYLQLEKLNVDQIVNELYDFSKLGAFSIPNVITEVARTEILEARRAADHLFHQAQREKGEVIQEMRTLYIERFRDNEIPDLLRNCLGKFNAEFRDFYARIAKAAGFSEKTYNSIGIHSYPLGSIGISPHQDYATDVDLVTSLVIAGYADFFVCKNREKEGSEKIEASPGSIVFMRAARNSQEQRARPFHYLVGPMTEERVSVLVRRRKEAKDKHHSAYSI